MNITVSQHGKKIIAEFHYGKSMNKYLLDKAEDFLVTIDRFIMKRKISSIGHIEFHNTGILTERIIRAIIAGLRF